MPLWRRGIPTRPSFPGARYPGLPSDRRVPWLLLLLPLAALAGWGVPQLLEDDPSPQAAASGAIGGTYLEGERALAGKLCIAIASDTSTSMDQVEPLRREATNELLPWLRANLPADDEVALAVFTDEALLTLAPTPVGSAPAAAPGEVPVGTGQTVATTAADALGQAFGGRSCASTALLAISDGEFQDEAGPLAAALDAAGITQTWVLNPKGPERSPVLQSPELADVHVTPISTSDDIGLTFARVIAGLTGQRLAGAPTAAPAPATPQPGAPQPGATVPQPPQPTASAPAPGAPAPAPTARPGTPAPSSSATTPARPPDAVDA
ncbi:vWA domain-containing protein [Motilibacter deserti]|uniref:von Willebrand factor type A domain-containing protein n=1 Tax=Motilibacter deserti TaxID=2714956 RepID=A0ABX0GUR6_9ACTN|nr:hypothetical protein [Motilibacter deserti]NHC13485.1 hypothetical protein [Motilibacter deserti]